MNEKFDKIIDALGNTLDSWIESFKTDPVKTTIKVLVVIYIIKKAKALLRDVR